MTPPEGSVDDPNAAIGEALLMDFDAIDPAVWDAVARQRRTPMHQHIWARAAAAAINPDRPPAVYCVGAPEAPLALAAFACETRGPARLKLLGAEELGEPVEVSYADPAALPALARALARTGASVYFGHYYADTPWTAALKGAYRSRGVVLERALPIRAAPTIVLDESWTQPEMRLSSRRRSDLRRMRRNAEQMGAVSADFLAPAPDDVEALLDEAYAIESRSWKARTGTAIAQNEVQARFYRHYARLAAARNMLRINFLRIDGAAIAMQIAVETEDGFWLLKIGYDEAFKRCSPGNLLIWDAIRRAAEARLKTFEFLGKEAAWTQLWTTDAKPVAALRAYPASLGGLAALAADGATLAHKRLKTRAAPASGEAVNA